MPFLRLYAILKSKISIFNYCLIAFIFNSCEKGTPITADNPYGLPNATQTGVNMISCRINDSNWFSKESSFSLGTSFSRNNNRDTLYYFGSPTSNSYSLLYNIRFQIFDRIKTGLVYLLNDSTKAIVTCERVSIGCDASATNGEFAWENAINGNITFTRFSGLYTVPTCCTHGSYDPNAIISGTFHFNLPFSNCDTIRVTDGRFDINYSNY